MTRRWHPVGSDGWPSLKLLALTTATLWILASPAQAGPGAAGSGSGSTAPPTASPAGVGWNGLPMGQRSADARFIVMMIPHHEGAIAMADLALKRSKRPEIRALAERIRTSQSRENAQMRRWYRQWYGTDVPIWYDRTGTMLCFSPGQKSPV